MEVLAELNETELIRLRAGLLILALHRVGDAELAEEIAQESLARVIEAIRAGQLRERDKLGNFARAIAHHVSIDALRHRQRTVSLDDSPESTTREEDALLAICSREQSLQLRQALNQLTGRDRELMRLCFFEGMNPQQIATRLGEPGPRIRKRKERALERLRQALRKPERHDRPPSATESRRPRMETDDYS